MADDSDGYAGAFLQVMLLVDVGASAACLHLAILPSMHNTNIARAVALGFWASASLMVMAFFRAWRTDPNRGVDPTDLFADPHESGETVRFCKACKGYRPPRAHHCSKCRKCVLRYDHHCMCFRSCVGQGNAKFFILFLLYGFLTSVIYLVAAVSFSLSLEDRRKLHAPLPSGRWVALVLVTEVAAFGGSVALSRLLAHHAYLLATNRTSLDLYRMSVQGTHGDADAVRTLNPWDKGLLANIREVLGPTTLLWLLPVAAPHPLAPRLA
mmetsp:Transcript_11898/g.28884  ORF Transcript_11898/g.28884 Transcript_11898/m.28884 type:complete len:268 (+) Transcript_11898:268-1071(+)